MNAAAPAGEGHRDARAQPHASGGNVTIGTARRARCWSRGWGGE